jgi:hypothetical protein
MNKQNNMSNMNKQNNMSNMNKQNNMSNMNKLNNKSNNMQNKQYINSKPSFSASGYSGSSVFGIVLLVIVIIIVASVAYWAYGVYNSKKFETSVDVVALADVKNASSVFAIGSGTIPNSTYSNAYSISMWLNIADYSYNYGNEKVILRRGVAGSGNPEIVLGDKSNDLIVRLKLQSAIGARTNIVNISSGVSPSVVSGIAVSKFENIQPAQEHTDAPKISDNSAPFESQVIQKEFFDMISGNEVNTGKTSIEKFDNVSDTVNAMVAVLIDLCNLSTALKSQSNADDQVLALNTTFQQIIDSLEQTRTASATASATPSATSNIITNDMSSGFNKLISNLPALLNSSANPNITQIITKLQTDITALQGLTANNGNGNISISSIESAVNSKLATTNCAITLNGSSDTDLTVNLFESLMNLIKQSLYTYINNMSNGIQKVYPNLGQNANVNCLLDTQNKDPSIGSCVYKMLPLQKWVHVIVSVNNQVVDIYVDGQLGSSCVLKGFPAISTDDISLTPDGGFSGQISQVIFSNTAMTIPKMQKLYYAGPVPSNGILSTIPSWVWYIIIIIIVAAVIYSVVM